MVRPMLTPGERERGRLLGVRLRAARGTRSMVDIATASGVRVETLRKIEAGRVPTPAFFTVVALAVALDLSLADLVGDLADHDLANHDLAVHDLAIHDAVSSLPA